MSSPTVRAWPSRRGWWATLARDLLVGTALSALGTVFLLGCWLIGQARGSS